MKCTACGYEDEIQGDLEGFQQGPLGDFFVSTLTREHPRYSSLEQQAKLLGCPACGNVFISTKPYRLGERH